MSRVTSDLLLGVARATLLAAITWVGAVTGLFVAFRLSLDRFRSQVKRQSPGIGDAELQQAITKDFPVDGGGIASQYLDWVVSYGTLDFGRSSLHQIPVREVFLTALPKSLIVLLAVVVAVVAMAVPLLRLGASSADDPGRSALALTAYALGSVPPVVYGVFVVGIAYQVGLPTRLAEDGATGGFLPKFELLAFVAVAVATPIVADLVRRVDRERVTDGGIDGLRAVFGLSRGGVGTLEYWSYALYLASSLVVVEYVFTYRGVGHVWLDSLMGRDYPALLGLTAGVVFVLVSLGFVRNLAGTVAEYLRGDAATAEERVHQPASDARTVVRAVARRPRVRVGLWWFAGALAVGTIGSAVISGIPQSAAARRSVYGLAPGPVINTVGAVVTVVLVAVVLGVVLGATGGLLAGYLAAMRGRVTGALAALVRIPADVWLVAPGTLVVGTVVGVAGTGSRTETELLLGATAGLIVAAVAFRGVSDAARVRFGTGASPGGAAAESVVAGLARTDGVVVFTAFLAGELAFLGLLPHAVLPTFFDLNRGFTTFSLLIDGSGFLQMITVLLACTIATGSAVLGVMLVGDGLGAAAAELRTAGSESASRSGSDRASDANAAPVETTG